MSTSDDDLGSGQAGSQSCGADAELEQLIVGAKPTGVTRTQEQMLYAAGRAVGLAEARSAQRVTSRKLWLSVASHVVCSAAAAWLAIALVPRLATQADKEAQENSPTVAERVPTIESSIAIEQPSFVTSGSVLTSRTPPEVFVRMLSERDEKHRENKSTAPVDDTENVLKARSVIF